MDARGGGDIPPGASPLPWALLGPPLAAFAAGTLAQLAAELLLFRELPAPDATELLAASARSGFRLLPIGLALGVLFAVRAPRLAPAIGAFTIAAAIGVVPLAVLAAAGELSGLVALVAATTAIVLALALAVVAHRSRLVRTVLVLLALVSPLAALSAPFVAPATRPGTPLASAAGHRVVLLGLDGATWDVMDPMIERGELPAISALMARGAHGNLRSLAPTLSNRVWTSAATGVVPERHGITDFFFDRRFIRVPTIWDLVHAAGGRVGLFEYLVTDPPLPFNGFVLPGWMANRPTDTHPPRLTRKLRVFTTIRHPFEVARYLLRRNGADKRLGERQIIQARLMASGFLALCDRFDPDLSACVWYGTDRLGHTMWRYFRPDSFPGAPTADDRPQDLARYRETIPRYYREADRWIGHVIRELDDGFTTFLLMSDHGMGAMDSVSVTGYVKGARALDRLGLAGTFYVENPHSVMFLNAKTAGRVDEPSVPDEEKPAALAHAIERFAAITRAESGAPLFAVERGDGEKVDIRVRVPDAASLSPETPVALDGARFPAGEIVQLVEVSGNHRMDGIVVLAGPAVRGDGARIQGAVITDVAPTIARLLGLPIAQDLDGRVLEAALDPGWLGAHPARTVATYGAVDSLAPEAGAPDEGLIERLRSLGYID